VKHQLAGEAVPSQIAQELYEVRAEVAALLQLLETAIRI
jgi:hypothetical protein